MHCKLEDCSWVHSFPIPRPFSSIVMSTEVHHLDMPQTLDIESGHHEPWSLQTVSENLHYQTPLLRRLWLRTVNRALYIPWEKSTRLNSSRRAHQSPYLCPSQKRKRCQNGYYGACGSTPIGTRMPRKLNFFWRGLHLQEVFRFYLVLQYDWSWSCGIWSFHVCCQLCW